MKKNFLVKDEFINSRLDRWFRRNVSDVPQSFIEKNIRKGNKHLVCFEMMKSLWYNQTPKRVKELIKVFLKNE